MALLPRTPLDLSGLPAEIRAHMDNTLDLGLDIFNQTHLDGCNEVMPGTYHSADWQEVALKMALLEDCCQGVVEFEPVHAALTELLEMGRQAAIFNPDHTRLQLEATYAHAQDFPELSSLCSQVQVRLEGLLSAWSAWLTNGLMEALDLAACAMVLVSTHPGSYPQLESDLRTLLCDEERFPRTVDELDGTNAEIRALLDFRRSRPDVPGSLLVDFRPEFRRSGPRLLPWSPALAGFLEGIKVLPARLEPLLELVDPDEVETPKWVHVEGPGAEDLLETAAQMLLENRTLTVRAALDVARAF